MRTVEAKIVVPVPAARQVEIGSRLRGCREGLHLSLEAVAARLSVSKQSVSAWETGHRELSARRLADLVLIYGVSSDYILFGTHMVPDELRDVFWRARGSPPSA